MLHSSEATFAYDGDGHGGRRVLPHSQSALANVLDASSCSIDVRKTLPKKRGPFMGPTGRSMRINHISVCCWLTMGDMGMGQYSGSPNMGHGWFLNIRKD